MNKLMMMAMVAAMGVAGSAWAAATIGYSGQLRDENGGVLSADKRQPTITFTLYDAPTDGTALWAAKKKVVLNDSGLFSAELDDTIREQTNQLTNALQDVLVKYETLYIGLTPDGSSEIAPRQRILETPHASVATVAKTADTANKGADGFHVNGTATITTVQTTTLQADKVMQKVSTGTYYELLPRGTIVMWAGTHTSIPEGWALCDGEVHIAPDGTNVRTPNMLGRFPVCTGQTSKESHSYGYTDIGGAETVTLTEAQMPKHRHHLGTDWSHFHIKDGLSQWNGSAFFTPEYWWDGKESPAGMPNQDSKHYTVTTGGDGAHENRPPYFALAFIMKL